MIFRTRTHTHFTHCLPPLPVALPPTFTPRSHLPHVLPSPIYYTRFARTHGFCRTRTPRARLHTFAAFFPHLCTRTPHAHRARSFAARRTRTPRSRVLRSGSRTCRAGGHHVRFIFTVPLPLHAHVCLCLCAHTFAFAFAFAFCVLHLCLCICLCVRVGSHLHARILRVFTCICAFYVHGSRSFLPFPLHFLFLFLFILSFVWRLVSFLRFAFSFLHFLFRFGSFFIFHVCAFSFSFSFAFCLCCRAAPPRRVRRFARFARRACRARTRCARPRIFAFGSVIRRPCFCLFAPAARVRVPLHLLHRFTFPGLPRTRRLLLVRARARAAPHLPPCICTFYRAFSRTRAFSFTFSSFAFSFCTFYFAFLPFYPLFLHLFLPFYFCLFTALPRFLRFAGFCPLLPLATLRTYRTRTRFTLLFPHAFYTHLPHFTLCPAPFYIYIYPTFPFPTLLFYLLHLLHFYVHTHFILHFTFFAHTFYLYLCLYFTPLYAAPFTFTVIYLPHPLYPTFTFTFTFAPLVTPTPFYTPLPCLPHLYFTHHTFTFTHPMPLVHFPFVPFAPFYTFCILVHFAFCLYTHICILFCVPTRVLPLHVLPLYVPVPLVPTHAFYPHTLPFAFSLFTFPFAFTCPTFAFAFPHLYLYLYLCPRSYPFTFARFCSHPLYTPLHTVLFTFAPFQFLPLPYLCDFGSPLHFAPLPLYFAPDLRCRLPHLPLPLPLPFILHCRFYARSPSLCPFAFCLLHFVAFCRVATFLYLLVAFCLCLFPRSFCRLPCPVAVTFTTFGCLCVRLPRSGSRTLPCPCPFTHVRCVHVRTFHVSRSRARTLPHYLYPATAHAFAFPLTRLPRHTPLHTLYRALPPARPPHAHPGPPRILPRLPRAFAFALPAADAAPTTHTFTAFCLYCRTHTRTARSPRAPRAPRRFARWPRCVRRTFVLPRTPFCTFWPASTHSSAHVLLCLYLCPILPTHILFTLHPPHPTPLPLPFTRPTHLCLYPTPHTGSPLPPRATPTTPLHVPARRAAHVPRTFVLHFSFSFLLHVPFTHFTYPPFTFIYFTHIFILFFTTFIYLYPLPLPHLYPPHPPSYLPLYGPLPLPLPRLPFCCPAFVYAHAHFYFYRTFSSPLPFLLHLPTYFTLRAHAFVLRLLPLRSPPALCPTPLRSFCTRAFYPHAFTHGAHVFDTRFAFLHF